MEKHHAKDVEDSGLDVCTLKHSDKKLAEMKSKSKFCGGGEKLR